MCGVHRHGRATRREISALEHERPVRAAVGRAIQAAIGAIAPEFARHARVDDVSVLRTHDDARDALAVRQPDVGPVVAAVGRFVDAVAHRDAVARPTLARADPHRVVMRRVERDRADRLHRLLVEDGVERRSAVARFPHAARSGADEQRDLAVLLAPARDRGNAARHLSGTDVADPETGDCDRSERRRGPRYGRERGCGGGKDEPPGRHRRERDRGPRHFAPGATGIANIFSSMGRFARALAISSC